MKASAFVVSDELAIIAGIYIVIVMEAAAAQKPRPLSLKQDALECLPEFRVKYAVNDGIKSRVGVPEPREDLEGCLSYAGLAEGRHDVDTEKRHPADFLALVWRDAKRKGKKRRKLVNFEAHLARLDFNNYTGGT